MIDECNMQTYDAPCHLPIYKCPSAEFKHRDAVYYSIINSLSKFYIGYVLSISQNQAVTHYDQWDCFRCIILVYTQFILGSTSRTHELVANRHRF